MVSPNPPSNRALAAMLKSYDQRLTRLETRDVLQNASIGANGLTVTGGGSITVTGGGSINVTGGGSITLPTGTFSAANLTATSTVQGAAVVSTGGVSVGTNINAPNGTLVSVYARNNSVVSSYVAAYIDGSGNFLSTPSAKRMKRDVEDAHWTPEQWRGIRTVFYRLRAAYILADMRGDDPAAVERMAGVIGEELLALGLDEFVVLDPRGRVFTVHYELLALVAIDAAQQLANQVDALAARLDAAGL